MDVLIPKGHDKIICKNEKQRSKYGGLVSTTMFKSDDNTFVFVVEDHVDDTKKVSPVFKLREIEVIRDVMNDLMWKAV